MLVTCIKKPNRTLLNKILDQVKAEHPVGFQVYASVFKTGREKSSSLHIFSKGLCRSLDFRANTQTILQLKEKLGGPTTSLHGKKT